MNIKKILKIFKMTLVKLKIICNQKILMTSIKNLIKILINSNNYLKENNLLVISLYKIVIEKINKYSNKISNNNNKTIKKMLDKIKLFNHSKVNMDSNKDLSKTVFLLNSIKINKVIIVFFFFS